MKSKLIISWLALAVAIALTVVNSVRFNDSGFGIAALAISITLIIINLTVYQINIFNPKSKIVSWDKKRQNTISHIHTIALHNYKKLKQ